MHLPDRFLLLDAILCYNPQAGDSSIPNILSLCLCPSLLVGCPMRAPLCFIACHFRFLCQAGVALVACILLMIGLLSAVCPASWQCSAAITFILAHTHTHMHGTWRESHSCTSDMVKFIFAFPTLIFIRPE